MKTLIGLLLKEQSDLSALFVFGILSETLEFEILGHLPHCKFSDVHIPLDKVSNFTKKILKNVSPLKYKLWILIRNAFP